MLLVEQDVFFAFEVADRGYVLEGGSVVREGAAKALANDPQVQAATPISVCSYAGASTSVFAAAGVGKDE